MNKMALQIAMVLGAFSPVACGGGDSDPVADGGVPDGPLAIVISPGEAARPISPLIYGINGAPGAADLGATLVRLGGRPLSAYNWEINATNGGSLEGSANAALGEGAAAGAAAKEVIDAAAASGGVALLTIPVGDYVAADQNPGDVQTSGPDFLDTRFRKNEPIKGAALLPKPDLTDDSVYQDEFVSWAKGVAGTTPVVFALDNEPELWSDDHPESHPVKSTYDDVVLRNTEYAKAVKAAWPGAPVTGSVSYGWQGFVNLQNSPDSESKGEFLDYYLDAMKAAETANGERLLDYLDLHWWPEAQGAGIRIIGPDSAPEIALARLQAPRSLWDETYHEASWIDAVLGGETIQLIPRMTAKIAAHYPDTQLAFSAWYFGGGGHVSGALATADVLGIFGREGVDFAAVALSEDGSDDSYTLAGFRSFLSFDGAGAHFGDTSEKAITSDPVGSSVYASSESSDPTHIVILAINKADVERPASLEIAGATTYGSCAVYVLRSDTGAKLVAATPLTSSGSNKFGYSMPATSVSVIVPQQ